MRAVSRQLVAGIRVFVLLSVLLGLGWPLAFTGLAQVVARDQANGSLIERDGAVVGSRLLGQRYDGPQWFQPRPSASEYSGQTSGSFNLSPVSADHLATVAQRRTRLLADNPGADPAALPSDALSASASGLDPHISPAYAAWQVPRVAAARRLPPDRVRAVIKARTRDRTLGFLGSPRVSVTELNVALSQTGAGLGS